MGYRSTMVAGPKAGANWAAAEEQEARKGRRCQIRRIVRGATFFQPYSCGGSGLTAVWSIHHMGNGGGGGGRGKAALREIVQWCTTARHLEKKA